MSKAPAKPEQTSGITSHRPVISARRHVISAGHYLAAHAGFAVLEAGGNAIDAGVAAGIALGVLQSDLVNVAGVAPIILYHAESRKVFTVSGLGVWPKLVTPDYFMKRHGGKIPRGLLRTVVPAAPDAWIQALQRWGTMSFGEVAAAAVRFAKEGFAAHPLLCETITTHRKGYEEWPSNRAIYLPNGRPPQVGRGVRAERPRQQPAIHDRPGAGGGGQGPPGRPGGGARGLLHRRPRAHDRRLPRSRTAACCAWRTWPSSAPASSRPSPCRSANSRCTRCGPWCQGPVLGQMLRLVEATGCHKQPHNSFAYVHALTEIMKLAFADRHAYYGDPRFVDVPLERLLSRSLCGRARGARPRRQGVAGHAAAGARQAGHGARRPGPSRRLRSRSSIRPTCASVDRHGNVFSATPSDVSSSTPVIPGTGLCPSSRGSQSWADPVARRPRSRRASGRG